MRLRLFFLLFTGIAVNGMAQDSGAMQFKTAADGSGYLVVPAVNGKKILAGQFLELNVTATYKDSLLFSTLEEGMPQYGAYDTASFPSPFKESFLDIHVGDSIILRIITDSILARGQAAPFLKKGEFVYQSYLIKNAYSTKEEVDSAQRSHAPIAKEIAYKRQRSVVENTLIENKDQIAADSKLIEAYLAKKKWKAVKTAWGTYIVYKKEGTGKKLSREDVASVNYTGKIMGNTKVFDSNTDPKFKHVTPYEVPLGQLSGIIAGWPDAILQMKKGTVATVLIPSALAYGNTGREPDIKPNAILEFDMTIVKVMTETENEKNLEKAKEKVEADAKKLSAPKQKTIPHAKTKTPVKPTVKPKH